MTRTTDFGPIEPAFLRRHSPRAMSGTPLPRAELMRLFEAARWAPSSANQQPWRFVLAEVGGAGFKDVLNSLAPFNQPWCARASALIVICTEKNRTNADGSVVPRRLGAFDAGAAWMSLALQGHAMGLVVHGMEGFDQVGLAATLNVPTDLDVLCVVAVGLPGDPTLLHEKQLAGEEPNGRRPTAESVVFNRF